MTDKNKLNNLFIGVLLKCLATEPECIRACLHQLNSNYPAQSIQDKAKQLLLAARVNKAQSYFYAYAIAIEALAHQAHYIDGHLYTLVPISIKLSAL